MPDQNLHDADHAGKGLAEYRAFIASRACILLLVASIWRKLANEVCKDSPCLGSQNTQKHGSGDIPKMRPRESGESHRVAARKKTKNICEHITRQILKSLPTQKSAGISTMRPAARGMRQIQNMRKSAKRLLRQGQKQKSAMPASNHHTASLKTITRECSLSKTMLAPYVARSMAAHAVKYCMLIIATKLEKSGSCSAQLAILRLGKCETTFKGSNLPSCISNDMPLLEASVGDLFAGAA